MKIARIAPTTILLIWLILLSIAPISLYDVTGEKKNKNSKSSVEEKGEYDKELAEELNEQQKHENFAHYIKMQDIYLSSVVDKGFISESTKNKILDRYDEIEADREALWLEYNERQIA